MTQSAFNLDAHYRKADRIMLGVLWLMFLYALGLVAWHGTWAQALLIGGGTALVLTPQPHEGFCARIEIGAVEANGAAASTLTDPDLEALRGGNPAARLLPLLAAIASNSRSPIVLAYGRGRTLQVNVDEVR